MGLASDVAFASSAASRPGAAVLSFAPAADSFAAVADSFATFVASVVFASGVWADAGAAGVLGSLSALLGLAGTAAPGAAAGCAPTGRSFGPLAMGPFAFGSCVLPGDSGLMNFPLSIGGI